MLGMGFSTLSEGQLIIEQDGWRQIYTMELSEQLFYYSISCLSPSLNN